MVAQQQELTSTTGSVVSPLATFEQRQRFNAVYRFIKVTGTEITDEIMAQMDREARLEWIQTAHIYARLYRGGNDFMHKMRAIADSNAVLSVRQARCVLNQIHRDGTEALAKRNTTVVSGPTTATPPGVPVAPVAPAAPVAVAVATTKRLNGYYTVTLADGSHVTLQVEDDFRHDQPAGAQMVSYLMGPANETDYKGFAFIGVDGSIRVWRSAGDVPRQRQALSVLLAASDTDAKEMGMAYCREANRCCVCGRLLTVPGSIDAGIGPVCRKRWGL